MIDNSVAQVRSTAQAIIQEHLGPSKKVINKRAIYYALVRALTEARQQGRQELA
jgi:hypothetical protein